MFCVRRRCHWLGVFIASKELFGSFIAAYIVMSVVVASRMTTHPTKITELLVCYPQEWIFLKSLLVAQNCPAAMGQLLIDLCVSVHVDTRDKEEHAWPRRRYPTAPSTTEWISLRFFSSDERASEYFSSRYAALALK